MEKVFAIGDIHGSVEKLDGLLEMIDIDFERDTLVFIGDYIDRGMHSYEVVNRLIALKHRHPTTIMLKGNHEQMLQDYLAGTDQFTYLSNGGIQTLESYSKHRREPDNLLIPQSHLEFFKSLPLSYQTDDYIFVHAGLKPKVPLEKQKAEDMLWIRARFLRSNYDFGKRVVFGHTPFTEPMVMPNKIGIDTGAVYGGKLTCVQLPDLEFHFSP